MNPAEWQAHQVYLYGFDLFNEQFFWEAHETWESLWHAHDRRGIVADFVKGLIKLSASGVKHLEGSRHGATTHARRAADLWRAVAGSVGDHSGRFLGLRIAAIIELADGIAEAGWPETPVLLLPSLADD